MTANKCITYFVSMSILILYLFGLMAQLGNFKTKTDLGELRLNKKIISYYTRRRYI